MSICGHLGLEEVSLRPGAEWSDPAGGWRFVRMSRGVAYWLSVALNRELTEGEVVVAKPGARGCVRASQLNEAHFHCCHFQPDLLTGLLTLAERHYFENVAPRTRPPVEFLPAAHPAAKLFAELVAQEASQSGLFQRAKLLDLLAALFGEDLQQHQRPPRATTDAKQRFVQLIKQMSDQEVILYTTPQLAELCGLSVRHFSRLFREHFGTSPRAKQIQLRLAKARQLLGSSDDKVLNVALDSGFRSLGLFNTLFKRHCGMTPSEWRLKQRRNGNGQGRGNGNGHNHLRAAALALLATLTYASSRAAVPDAPPAPAGREAATLSATNAVPETAAERLRRIEREIEVRRQGRSSAGPAATETRAERLERIEREVAGRNTSSFPTNTPAAAPRPPGTFEIQAYEVRGNSLLPPTLLQPLLQKHNSPTATFETIRGALADLQMAYRDRGYVTVAVTLPQQQLTNHTVKVQVLEGRLAEINVVSNRFFSSNNVLRSLPCLRTNSLLNALVFQQELDRANASRDRQVYPVLGPGPEPGTSALTLRVKDRLPLHARLELNNNSTPNTPELRVNSALQYNNLWQLEHQFGVQYSFTPEQFKGGSAPFYEAPLIASYSAFYRLPLAGVNGPPRAGEYAIGDFGYDEVTKRFRPPAARGTSELLFYASRSSSDTSRQLASATLEPPVIPPAGVLQTSDRLFNQTLTVNENAGVRWLQPLPVVGALQSSLAVGLDYKKYRAETVQDRIFAATIWTPSVGIEGPPFDEIPSPPIFSSQTVFSAVTYLPFSLSWEGSLVDKHGSTSFNVNQSLNIGGLLGSTEELWAVAGSAKAQATFYTLGLGLTRDQKISGEWGVRLHADGQFATSPLISNEQFGLGGAAGVRGYRDGEEYGDTGWRVLCEPYTPAFNLGLVDGTAPLLVKFSAFLDYGQRYLLDPGTRPGTVSMLGTGFGGTLNIGQRFDLRTQIGMPLLDVPGRSAHAVRVLFGVGLQF